MRRPLAETLVELSGALAVPTGLRITGLTIDVPLEVRLERHGDEWELRADLPQWRWQTGLEELRSRLRVRWEEGATP